MAAKEFVIDDGVQEYAFKNKKGDVFARFSISPSDTGLFKRYEDVVKAFEEYDARGNTTAEDIVKLDEYIKEQFDKLFQNDSSNTLFAQYTPCTLFPNGDFFAEVALDYIGKIIADETGKRYNKKITKIKALTEKSRKYK